MATPRKTTTTKDVDKVEVVENNVEDKDVSPVEREATGETEVLTFTVEVDGETIKLEDRWTRTDKVPAGMVGMGSASTAMKYIMPLLHQIVGEDQVTKLMEAGADAEELISVANAWSEARGLGETD